MFCNPQEGHCQIVHKDTRTKQHWQTVHVWTPLKGQRKQCMPEYPLKGHWERVHVWIPIKETLNKGACLNTHQMDIGQQCISGYPL